MSEATNVGFEIREFKAGLGESQFLVEPSKQQLFSLFKHTPKDHRMMRWASLDDQDPLVYLSDLGTSPHLP